MSVQKQQCGPVAAVSWHNQRFSARRRTMIQVQQLSHRHAGAEAPALSDISLAIGAGEAVGLLGPNGAGKTTLMSLMCGLLPAQQGQVLLQGQPVGLAGARLRRLVSLVPQDFAFYPLLTVQENLDFFAALYGVDDHDWLATLVAQTDLGAHRHKLARALSGGLKRRLNFAIGLINRPRLLFLDEITVGIDPESRQFILEAVAELGRQGTTLIYTSHYLQELELLCRRLVLLHEGRLIHDGPMAPILSAGSLESFYFARLHQAAHQPAASAARQPPARGQRATSQARQPAGHA